MMDSESGDSDDVSMLVLVINTHGARRRESDKTQKHKQKRTSGHNTRLGTNRLNDSWKTESQQVDNMNHEETN